MQEHVIRIETNNLNVRSYDKTQELDYTLKKAKV